MALANYTDLQASVARWLDRTDMGALIPDFVALAEVRIARDLRDARLERAFTVTTEPGRAAYPVPEGIVSLVRVHMLDATGRPKPLEAYAAELIPGGPARARPRYYAFDGGGVTFGPVPDGAYPVTLAARGNLPALATAPGGTNFVLSAFPNVYLFATLIEAADFTLSDELLGKWENRYRQAIGAANKAANFKRGALLTTELGRMGSRGDITTGFA